MVYDFLTPISKDIQVFAQHLSAQMLGKKMALHTVDEMPDLDSVSIAVIGVLDNRGNGQSGLENLNFFRKAWYQLYPGNWSNPIADLGDLKPGEALQDTYFALAEITSFLIKKNIIPIYIGGSQDLTYGIYRGYDQLDQMVNLVNIDSKFDLGSDEEIFAASSFVSRMIVDEPNNLFNYSNIGYQTYFNSQESIDLIEKLYFDAIRLGEVVADLTITEPIFRDADLVSVDLTSIMSANSGNFVSFAPNGFNGKDICALMRYAGISDKVSSFGLFNHKALESESQLMAQMIWYFVEGVNFRSYDYPSKDSEHFIKYIVLIDDQELVFYQSAKTSRWWIEIPFFLNVNNKLKKSTLLPCTHEDYLKACDQEMPERWWKAQRKNAL